jgi:hypothetical protein
MQNVTMVSMPGEIVRGQHRVHEVDRAQRKFERDLNFPKRIHQPPFTQQAKKDATEFWLPARAALPKALP